MNVSPKIITGALHTQNKGACDWGWQGLLAYGCHQYVVVIDPDTSQNVQTLLKHKENVTVVKWRRENTHHDVAYPYRLCLASGDTSGKVVIWNVTQGVSKLRFEHGNKAVIDMNWLYEAGKLNMLLALYSGSSVVLWDCLIGSQVWKKVYTESLVSVSLDPFNSHNAVFLGEDCALLITDLDIERPPLNSGSKIYTCTALPKDTGMGSSPATPVTPMTTESSGVRRNSSSWNKLVSFTSNSIQNILTGEIRTKDSKQRKSISEVDDTNNCIQAIYHPGVKYNLLLVYPNQIIIFDIEVQIVVCTVKLSKAASPFLKVIPCQNKDILFCLHENGSISVRLRRVDASFCPPNHNDEIIDLTYDLVYDNLCQSDTVRITNTSYLVGFTYNPVTEKTLSIVLGDGRVLFWDVIHGPGERKFLKRCQCSHPDITEMSISTISDLIGPTVFNLKHKPNLRLLLTRVVYGLISSITVLKICPSRKKNCMSILAIGSESGTVQLLDLDSDQIIKEFDVFFNGSVCGIEWICEHSMITWSSPSVYNAAVQGQVRNIIYQFSLQSGQISPLRVKKDPEMMITSIKISPYRQFILIAFEKQPLEIWSLGTKRLLREMPSEFPQPNEMFWLPTFRKKKLQKLPKTTEIINTVQTSSEKQIEDTGPKTVCVERVLITDKLGTICLLTLEDSIVTDMVKLGETLWTEIAHAAMKFEYLIIGDTSGCVRVARMKSKVNQRILYDKPIKGLKKIESNPSLNDATFLVHYENNVDTWRITSNKNLSDQFEVEIMSTLKFPQDFDKITEVEWTNRNQLLILTQNGCLHVFDQTHSYSRSLFNGRNLEDPVFCPYMLPIRSSLLLKQALKHHQEIILADSNDNELILVQEQTQIIDRHTLNYLFSDSISEAERYLYVARLFGDEFDIQFWTLCHYFLDKAPVLDNNELISFDEGSDQLKANKKKLMCDCCLEKKYDVLQADRCFKCQQLYRIHLHDLKRTTYEDGQKCVENYVLLDQMDPAVKILLETNFEKDEYKTDYVRACLLACERSTSTAQSILKLVATHLIIGSKLAEGIELMCLMGKTLDACKYLQSYGQWEKAAWLAKATLVKEECQQVFNKWIDHLIQNCNNDRAILIMISQGEFMKAIKFLNEIGYIDMAFNLMICCQKQGKCAENENDKLFSEVKQKYIKFLERLGAYFSAGIQTVV